MPITAADHPELHCTDCTVMAYSVVSSCVVSGVEVQKLRSTRTGLVVCTAPVEGPLVNGYFVLATEAHDHDGLPHTLEHLIFMGSEEYSYKGVLDILSNRCLAQGTNAWTDVDHTCYTVTTAGSEGFLNLLPIYLDHILYPTLTDAAYLTEVHHVNGSGEDAGVVYCEMQARENTPESLSIFHLFQDFYPGRCGYKSETGGLMKNLRESTSNVKVRDYHQSYYRHDNLCLIVTGQVNPDDLFKALQPIEDKILRKGSLPDMECPWQTPVPPLPDTVTREIPFPTDETEDGIVRMGWRGPSALDRYAMAAAGVLMEYLTDTPVAPIQRDLVEIEDPFSSEVSQTIVENLEVLVGFTLSGVPVDKLNTAPHKVLEILEKIASGKEAIDKERMTAIIKRQILNIHNQVEEVPHDFFAFVLIGDFLFGHTPKEFSLFLNQEPRLKQLLTEPPSFWTDLTAKYFTQAPHVTICGRPNAELTVTMATEQKEREAGRVKEWGEEGLKERERAVEEACKQNEIPPPDAMASSLPVPGTDSITFHPLSMLANYMSEEQLSEGAEYQKLPVDKIPFLFQLNHIHSGFVQLTAILDTAVLTRDQKLYLPLFQELLFESPMIRDGEVVPYEVVVNQLTADTVSYGAGLGQYGGRFSTGHYSQALFVSVKVEREKYVRGVEWLREALYNVQFTAERVGVVTNKILNDVPRLKRKGNHVVKTLLNKLLYTASSAPTLTNMVTQSDFLTSLTAKLKDGREGGVVSALTEVRDKLVSPDNLRVVMGTDVNRLTDPLEPWTKFAPKPSSVSPANLPHVLPSREFIDPGCVGRAVVAGVSGVESNFLMQSIPCVDSFTHPDYAAILVFMEYLCALEGPMWRQIRGMGLSYHYSMRCAPDSGRLSFLLFKSAQLVKAYEVAMEIMEGFLSGRTPFEQSQLEAAVSGVIYATIEREKTVSSMEEEATLNYLRQLSPDRNRKLLLEVSKVTIDDLKRVGGVYFTRLFDPKYTTTAIACSPSKVEEVKEGLTRCGLKVECLPNLSELSVLNE